MTSRNAALKSLYEWRRRHYFCSAAWEHRGLIKSPDPVPYLLDMVKTALVDDMLKAIFSGG